MEAVFLSSSPTSDHQSFSPSNRNNRNKMKSFHSSFNNISRSSENFSPPHSNLFSNTYGGSIGGGGCGGGIGGGSFFNGSPPPNLSSSFPLLPPLLPLPVTKPYSSLPLFPVHNNKVRNLPFSPSTNQNQIQNNKNKINERIKSDQKQDNHRHLKSKSSKINPSKKRDSSTRSSSIITKIDNTSFVIESSKRLGPEPGDLPKEVSRVFKPYLDGNKEKGVEVEFSSIFSLAPPPSSLPLPKFSLRPKLISCNVEAAGVIDDGATDNLRRLLRLR